MSTIQRYRRIRKRMEKPITETKSITHYDTITTSENSILESRIPVYGLTQEHCTACEKFKLAVALINKLMLNDELYDVSIKLHLEKLHELYEQHRRYEFGDRLPDVVFLFDSTLAIYDGGFDPPRSWAVLVTLAQLTDVSKDNIHKHPYAVIRGHNYHAGQAYTRLREHFCL